MIFLPDLAQIQKHIQGAKGANLSLVQDRKDAIRIIAYDSDSKEGPALPRLSRCEW